MKKLEERINEIVSKAFGNGSISNEDTIERIVAAAYFMGYEKGIKNASDEYTKLLREQKERAKKERYHNIAMRVQGNIDYIWMYNYSEPTKNELITDYETNL